MTNMNSIYCLQRCCRVLQYLLSAWTQAHATQLSGLCRSGGTERFDVQPVTLDAGAQQHG